MTGCACPHSADRHAPRNHFGQAICLAPGCDCDGTHEDVTAANERRALRLAPTNELLLSKIAAFISDEWKARRLMAEIVAEFDVVAR